MVPTSTQTSLSAPTSSAAYGGMLSVGSPTIGAPSSAVTGIMREIILGVVIAVLAGLVLRNVKS